MNTAYRRPDSLHKDLAFSQEFVTQESLRRVFGNIEVALSAAGARLEKILKWHVYIVQGQPPQPTFEMFQRVWGIGPIYHWSPYCSLPAWRIRTSSWRSRRLLSSLRATASLRFSPLS